MLLRDASKMTQHTAGSYLTTVAPYKGFGCRLLERRRGVFGGRRPKASKGNRA